ncbi:anthranilate synthase component I [Bacillus salitolerans]|uniref:Anthranilate synthase component 1 n=1 Tax=Bacillus salitolerans TaxID=1437434 RepID=A0ABW4LUS5_9BACI
MSTNEEAVFLEDTVHYQTIPVSRSYHVDTLTPIQLFQSLQNEAVYLLESNDEQSPWSNYSFIGLNPFLSIEEKNDELHVLDQEGASLFNSVQLEETLCFVNALLKIKELDLPIPFTGGGVGYIGYDAVSTFEKVPKHKQNDLKLKSYHLLYCETIVVFSHLTKKITFIHFARLSGNEQLEEKKQIFYMANKKINDRFEKVKNAKVSHDLLFASPDVEIDFNEITSSYTKEAFIRHVQKIKEYIAAGDVFQTVLSQRFKIPVTAKGFDLYRILRLVNPSPYLFYIKLKDCEIVGSSPEKLIQVSNGHLEIHPIAGTRRRGKTEEEDQILAEELQRDEKEQAEHYMLLDLARNDLGRVSEFGSIKTPMIKELHYFSHVMHLVSKVTGLLKDDVSPIDALLASFPAGTVSGAPKVRAMEIIQELEPVARNIYAGTVAYIGFDGNIDSCIAIRTAVIKDKHAYVQAGAGIVADSDPELEWKETINKASGVIKAIKLAEKTFSKEERITC